MTIKGEKKATGDVNNAQLSTTKTYYYAAFSKEEIQGCEMNDITDKDAETCKYS